MEQDVQKLNARQLRLKEDIHSNKIPEVLDISAIWDTNESSIPYHWGDIEDIGYGRTRRSCDRDGNLYISRFYDGPGSIKLAPHGIVLKKGMFYSD